MKDLFRERIMKLKNKKKAYKTKTCFIGFRVDYGAITRRKNIKRRELQ